MSTRTKKPTVRTAVAKAVRRLHEIAHFPTLTLGEKADLRAIATLLRRLAARVTKSRRAA